MHPPARGGKLGRRPEKYPRAEGAVTAKGFGLVCSDPLRKNRSGTAERNPPALSARLGRAGGFLFLADSAAGEEIIMFRQLKEDIACVRERDPAARSVLEVLLLYPGLKAIRMHRRANWCYRHRLFFLARWISQRAAHKTGIEIHPAAKIGRRFFIDHGTGVVIGETAEIGDDVTIYQGVTLGGTGKDTGKRHPTIGNNVMIGAGAKVLGPFKVGENSNIAAGAVVLEEIPPDSTAVGVPARVVKRNGVRVDNLDQVHVPDPVAQELCCMMLRIEQLERENAELEKERGKREET